MKNLVIFVLIAYFAIENQCASIPLDPNESEQLPQTRIRRFEPEVSQSDAAEPITPSEVHAEDETKGASDRGKDKPHKPSDKGPKKPLKTITTTTESPSQTSSTLKPRPQQQHHITEASPTRRPLVHPHYANFIPPQPQPAYHPYQIVEPANEPHNQPPSPYGNSFFSSPVDFEAPQNSYRQNGNRILHRVVEEDISLGSPYSPPSQNYAPQNPAAAYAPSDPASYAPSHYPSHAPSHPSYANYAPVQCPQNLLVSCQPSVQTVPCSSYSPPAPAYHPDPAYPAHPAQYAPQSPSYPQPSYREAEDEREDAFVGQPQTDEDAFVGATQSEQNLNEQEMMVGARKSFSQLERDPAEYMRIDFFRDNPEGEYYAPQRHHQHHHQRHHQHHHHNKDVKPHHKKAKSAASDNKEAVDEVEIKTEQPDIKTEKPGAFLKEETDDKDVGAAYDSEATLGQQQISTQPPMPTQSPMQQLSSDSPQNMRQFETPQFPPRSNQMEDMSAAQSQFSPEMPQTPMMFNQQADAFRPHMRQIQPPQMSQFPLALNEQRQRMEIAQLMPDHRQFQQMDGPQISQSPFPPLPFSPLHEEAQKSNRFGRMADPYEQMPMASEIAPVMTYYQPDYNQPAFYQPSYIYV